MINVNFIKIKNVWFLNDVIKKIKEKPTAGKKQSKIYIFDKVFIYSTYKNSYNSIRAK